jgi:hypothetical protein
LTGNTEAVLFEGVQVSENGCRKLQIEIQRPLPQKFQFFDNAINSEE